MSEKYMLATLSKSEYYINSIVKYITKEYVLHDRRGIIMAICNIIYENLHMDDGKIFTTILNVLVYPYSPKTIERQMERVTAVLELVKNKIVRYLDFGCGDGNLTWQIGNQLGLEPSNVYGIDIHHIDNVNIGHYSSGQLGDIADGSFDLITAFVSLHHVQDIHYTIQMLSRILAPGGTLIIREHDSPAWDKRNPEYLPIYLNLVHAWINIRDHGFYDPAELYKSINYRTLGAWTYLIQRAGLVFLGAYTYPGNNPQRLFYARYMKKMLL